MPPLVHTVHARIDGVIARETAAAVAFLVDDATVWIPKSQLFGIEYRRGLHSEEIRVGRKVRTVEIPGWLVREKNLEEAED